MFKNQSKIKDIVLAITYQCNSRCQFCHIWQRKDTFSLPATAYSNLPQNLKNINISGGEPFLRKDLAEIVRIITKQCPKAKIIISTNGFLTPIIEKQMEKILKINPEIGVAVSLDGLKKTHEQLRGIKAGYNRVLKTIKTLKKMGLKNLKIAFTLANQNAQELKDVYQLARKLGLEFSLSALHNSVHYFGKTDNQIKQSKEITKAIDWLIKKELRGFFPKRWLRAYYAWALLRFLETGQRVLPDYSGINSLFIDPFGRIYPSDVWGLKLGQLNKIKNWAIFFNGIQRLKTIKEKTGPANWMVCTARQAMRKHWLKVGLWIAREKIIFWISSISRIISAICLLERWRSERAWFRSDFLLNKKSERRANGARE